MIHRYHRLTRRCLMAFCLILLCMSTSQASQTPDTPEREALSETETMMVTCEAQMQSYIDRCGESFCARLGRNHPNCYRRCEDKSKKIGMKCLREAITAQH